ncbi:MAG: hypothetical protein ACC652_01215 [Acidimicrobiales bacterium]
MTDPVEPQSSAHPELSALLDGELSQDQESYLHERLVSDVALRLELRAASTMRKAVRSLPLVDVPQGTLERPDNVFWLSPARNRRPSPRRLPAVVAAIAAVWVFVLVSVTPGPAQAVPVVGSVNAHRASVASLASTPAVRPGAQSSFPQQIGDGLELRFVSRHGERVHLLYSSEDKQVSIFQQPGTLAAEKLPPGGSWLLVDGVRAWTWDDADLRVVVFERDDTVFTFVSGYADERPAETMASNTSVLPENHSSSWLARLSGATHRAALLLGFG